MCLRCLESANSGPAPMMPLNDRSEATLPDAETDYRCRPGPKLPVDGQRDIGSKNLRQVTPSIICGLKSTRWS